MALLSTHNPWLFAFGLLGNIASFIVFLAPVPTFYMVWKKKSTGGFQSLPYVVALFSAMLWLYYATLKSDVFLLITINSFGCLIETIYIALYIAYAPKQARMFTLRILILLNFGGFCLILLLSHVVFKGSSRAKVFGWICMIFSVTVFAAPLSVIRLVIRTKSVEFMPFYLSFFLTLSAVMWLFYGLLLKDIFITVPNIVGFVFGVLQMVLYVIYKNLKPVLPEPKLPQQDINIAAKLSTAVATEVQEIIICTEPNANASANENNIISHNENEHDKDHVDNHDCNEKSVEESIRD